MNKFGHCLSCDAWRRLDHTACCSACRDAARIAELEDEVADLRAELDEGRAARRREAALTTRIEQLEHRLRCLGACPDCGLVPKMDEERPFSSCACGTGEDYGRRPLQQLQLMQRLVQQIYGVAYPKQEGSKRG